MPALFHSYDSIKDVPPQVLQLYQELSRPLPVTLKSTLQGDTTLSSIARQSLQRILTETYYSPHNDTASMKILDVLDVALLTSATIEANSRILDGSGQRCTGQHWYTLLRTLGHVCYPGSRILTNVSFVCPRDFGREEGTASMLIGVVAPLAESPSDYNAIDRGRNSEEGRRTSTSGSHDDEDSRTDTSRDTNPLFDDTPSYEILDDAAVILGLYDMQEEHSIERRGGHLPIEACILAGDDVRPSVLLPVICAADMDGIIPLVTSAACQRHAWGMNIPVVGFEISKYGTDVQAYIAWTAPPSCAAEMPDIHILGPTPLEDASRRPTACTRLGIFDLSDPCSIVRLVLFVLSLASQFETLHRDLPPKFPDRLLWRADRHYGSTLDTKIVNWLQEVNIAMSNDESITSGASNTTSISIPASHSPLSLDLHMYPVSRSHKTRSSHQSDSESACPMRPKRSPSQVSSKLYATHFSCSEFAELDGVSTLHNPEATSVLSWLIQRFAFTLTRVEELKDTPLSAKPCVYDAMIDMYDKMTSFQFIQAWSLDDMGWMDATPVDKCFQHYRDILFDSYADLLRKSVSDDENVTVSRMDPTHADIIMSRLSLLLKAVDGCSIREAQEIQRNEADCRHDWNALMESFYVSQPSEITSDGILFDQCLRLPKNTLHEAFNSGIGLEAHQQLSLILQEQRKHANAVTKYCVKYMEELDFTGMQGHAFLLHSTQIKADIARQRITYHAPKLDQLEALVEKNYSDEPCIASCDVALFSPMLLEANTCRWENKEQAHQQCLFTSPGPTDSSLSSFSLQNTGCRPSVVLPQLLVEHSTPDKVEHVALNQDRMFCVAAVAYLASIGITDYPVFGLVTYGPIGAIIMAWRSKEGRTYLMERNARRFDLRKPLDALQFVSFLVRLRTRDQLMEDAYKHHKEEVERRLKKKDVVDWAMPLPARDDNAYSSRC